MKNLRSIIVFLLVAWLAVGNAFAATSVPAVVSATVSTTSEITVTPSTIGFGSIGANATTYRFRHSTPAGVVNIGYVAAGSYEIRVYTDNGVGTGFADARGFIRDATAATAHRLYPKIWCPNFSGNAFISGTAGPSFPAASAQTQYVWGGYDLNQDSIFNPDAAQVHPIAPATSTTFNEVTLGQDINGDGDILDTAVTATTTQKISEGPSLAYLREFDTHNEGTSTTAQVGTRCVLAWNTVGQAGRSTQDGSLSNPFPVILATDLTGIANGTYTSSNNGTTPITTGQTAQNGVIFEILIYP